MSYSDYDLHPKLFVLNGTVKTTGTSADLTAGDFGIYDVKDHSVVTSANKANHPVAYFAQGSYYNGDELGMHGGYTESIKSPAPSYGVDPRLVSKFYKEAPKAAVNQKVRLFWDGASGTAPKFLCGETYHVQVELKGEPILRFINRYVYKTFGLYTGCCPAGTPPLYTDPAVVLADLAKQINEDPIFSKFVSAEAFTSAASTTITTTSASATATVASGTGIAVGQKVIAVGVADGTTVSAVSGTTVTLSKPATATGSGVAASFSKVIADPYTPVTVQADIAAMKAGLDITVTYVDTTFGNCSFNQGDFYGKGAVDVLASMVDMFPDPCANGEVVLNSSTGEGFTELVPFSFPAGSGEEVLRDFIASQHQSGIYFSNDPRDRETTGNVAMTAVDRSKSYLRYYLIYKVPVKGNPSNALSCDQYILNFAVASGTSVTAFETLMLAWLQQFNAGLTLETIA